MNNIVYTGGANNILYTGGANDIEYIQGVHIIYSICGATRGVTVSMSAFLACHQCYCAGSSLAWGLNVRALVCGIF